MVGSILTTVEEGQEVKRGQEFGYFAFGAYIFSYPGFEDLIRVPRWFHDCAVI